MSKRFLWMVIVLLIIGLLIFLVVNSTEPKKESIQTPEQMQENTTTPETGFTMPQAEGNEMVYELIQEESSLDWKAERIIGNSHTGTVQISQGYLVKEEENFTKGAFLIDMTTITESKNNERFLGHIKTGDFFAVETYPTSTLVLKNIEKANDEQYNVMADLTILDQTHEIVFPATVREENGKVDASAEFTIDRTKWGIVYDSGSIFQQLGDKAIKDDIYYTIHVVLIEKN